MATTRESEDEGRTTKKRPPAKSVKAKPKAKAKAAAKEPKAAKNGADRKPPGAQKMIKVMTMKNPQITNEDMMNKLEKAGHDLTKTAAGSIKSSTLNTLRIADELGFWKGPTL